MSRCIDADSMRDEWLHNKQNENIYCANDVLDSIDEQPTVDVEPVRHGKWVMNNNVPVCSLCRNARILVITAFCPHCGAKMDGKETI